MRGTHPARLVAEHGEPLLVERPEQLEAFQRHLVAASRGARSDWASRFLLPPIEEFATEQLMETGVRPAWLIWTALGLTIGAAIAFVEGWPIAALVMLLLSAPSASGEDGEPSGALARLRHRLGCAWLVGDGPQR